MTRTILLDCDDVLLDWLGGFRMYMQGLLGRELDEKGPDSWDMSEWLGVPNDEVVEHIKEHNAGHQFGSLLPVPGAVEAIEVLSQTSDLHVLTSCSSDQQTWDMRYQNLREHFGPRFDSLTCLDLGQSKRDELAKYDGNVVWVEDNLKNAMLGVELGHRTYMRRTSHNRVLEPTSDKRITWFSHWNELNPERM